MEINIDLYNSSEITIHRMAQFMALTGANLIDKKPDDSHTNLAWEATEGLLSGRYFIINGQKRRLVFKPDTFQLIFQDNQNNNFAVFNAKNRSYNDSSEWWQQSIVSFGYLEKLTTALHYDLPEQAAYSSSGIKATDYASIKLWTAIRTQANDALTYLNDIVGIDSEIRIWPHHFDTGVYYPLKSDNEGVTCSVGAGLAIADSMIPEPYYYIYGWSKDGEVDLSKAPGLTHGRWMRKDWKGAVLPAFESREKVNGFFMETFGFLKEEIMGTK